MEPDTGKRVAIVGSSPSVSPATALLRRYGHHVVIYEEPLFPVEPQTTGIPDYHLPEGVLRYEIDRIVAQGVEIKTKVRVGQDVTLSRTMCRTARMREFLSRRETWM